MLCTAGQVTIQLAPDEELETTFELYELLGKGTFGEVWHAVHRPTGTQLALKRVPISDDLETLRREIDILMQCQSDDIVRFYGYHTLGSELFIFLELCHAGSALDVMHLSDMTYFDAEIACLLLSVVRALITLHGQRLVHRDIKSANILLTNQAACKLADFGVARELTPSINTMTVIGSPYWMAPEIISGKPYSEIADIWSLGITAIELADGHPPRSSMHPLMALMEIPRQDPPTVVAEEHTPEYTDFVRRCLTKNPQQRPSAAALLDHPFLVQARSAEFEGWALLTDRVDKAMERVGREGRAIIGQGAAGPTDGAARPSSDRGRGQSLCVLSTGAELPQQATAHSTEGMGRGGAFKSAPCLPLFSGRLDPQQSSDMFTAGPDDDGTGTTIVNPQMVQQIPLLGRMLRELRQSSSLSTPPPLPSDSAPSLPSSVPSPAHKALLPPHLSVTAFPLPYPVANTPLSVPLLSNPPDRESLPPTDPRPMSLVDRQRNMAARQCHSSCGGARLLLATTGLDVRPGTASMAQHTTSRLPGESHSKDLTSQARDEGAHGPATQSCSDWQQLKRTVSDAQLRALGQEQLAEYCDWLHAQHARATALLRRMRSKGAV